MFARPQGELPRITFVAADDEVAETPRGSAPIVAYLMEKFGLVEIAKELLGDKHHGLAIEHLILIFLLYAAYGATSVKDLKEKAQRDRALARLLEDTGIETIEDHVLRYFRKRHDVQTQEALLERFVLGIQDAPRFSSRGDGVIALDDSTEEKFGKHMEHIAVVFEHCEKRFCLGYVVVSTCYCDKDKLYPLNFEFRIRTEEEQRRFDEAKLKKEAGIDFRKKDAFPKWVQALEKENRLPTLFSLSGKQASVENFKIVDARNSIWVAAAHENQPLRDLGGKREWDLENLKRKTLANKPDVCEGEGFRIYTKEITLHKYEPEVDFIVITDLAGQEIRSLILQRVPHRERVARILKFFEREDEPESGKLHIGLRLIKRAKEKLKIKAETVAVDAWFFVTWFVIEVLQISGIKRLVSKLRVDQMVLYKGKWLRADELWELSDIRFRHDRKKQFKWAKLQVEIADLGLVAIVLVQELDKKRPWRIVSEYIIVCTDPEWAAQKIVAGYKLRWGIEVFYRAAKQRFGMAGFHDEKFIAIHFHMTFVFLSYLLTAVLRNMVPNPEEFTLGQIIDRYLRTLVRIKKKGRNIIVYLGPGFIELFGDLPPPLPLDIS
jgi:hypothetical protein